MLITHHHEQRITTGSDTGPPARSSSEEQRTEEVLAVDDHRVTKVRVTYDPGATKSVAPSASILTGHTYVVDSTTGSLGVTYATGGTAPSYGEVELVKRDYDALGYVLTASLPVSPLHVGDSVPSLAEVFTSRLFPQPPLKFAGAIAAHVEKASEDVVDFVLSGTATVTELGMMPMSWQIEGTLRVDARTGWPIKCSYGGPMVFGFDAGYGGVGAMSTSWTRTYSDP